MNRVEAGSSVDPRRGPKRSAIQRWSAVLGGGALAVYGLTRRSPLGIAVAAGGGALAYAGVKAGEQEGYVARGSVLVNCSPADAYRFWRDFQNLPLFMRHLDSVTVTPDGRSRWTAVGPLGTPVHWTAEIVSEQEGGFIAWRSLPGSDLNLDGSVEFRVGTGKRGTLVLASMRFLPPGGRLGPAVAKIIGKDPGFLMQQDLRRFKALIETGEIPTTEGQTHGPRDVGTAMARVIDPDRPLRRGVGLSELLEARRRVS